MRAPVEYHTTHELSGGSDKYGPCEVCKQKMGTAYMGKFYRTIRRPDGGISNPWFDKFGHRECLDAFAIARSQAA